MFPSKIIKITMCLGLIAVVCANDDNGEGGGMSLADIVAALKPMAEECPDSPSEAHIEAVVRNDESPPYIAKCFLSCLYKQFDVIKENETKLNGPKAVEILSLLFPDGKEDMGEIVEICNDINAGISEKCENAHQHRMCVIKNLKDRNYDIPKIE